MFVNNGKLEYVLNTSTGGGYTYSERNGAPTSPQRPTGVFHTYREVDGLVTDYLGQLWMPKYFTGGFAIHGDTLCASGPVSHGCVRVSDEAIEWIWANNLDPDRHDGLGLLSAARARHDGDSRFLGLLYSIPLALVAAASAFGWMLAYLRGPDIVAARFSFMPGPTAA